MTDAARGKLGYSSHTVWKWKRDPKIQRILALQSEMAEMDSELTTARIHREYGRLAFSSIGQFYDEANRFKKPSDWTAEMAAAVESIKFDEDGNITELKLHRKGAALDAVAKMRNLLIDKHEHFGKGGGPIQTASATLQIGAGTDPAEAARVYQQIIQGK